MTTWLLWLCPQGTHTYIFLLETGTPTWLMLLLVPYQYQQNTTRKKKTKDYINCKEPIDALTWECVDVYYYSNKHKNIWNLIDVKWINKIIKYSTITKWYYKIRWNIYFLNIFSSNLWTVFFFIEKQKQDKSI